MCIDRRLRRLPTLKLAADRIAVTTEWVVRLIPKEFPKNFQATHESGFVWDAYFDKHTAKRNTLTQVCDPMRILPDSEP